MMIYSLNLLVDKSGLLYMGLHLIFYGTYNILITDPKEKVMISQVFVCPHGSWLLVHCSALLRHGRYACYWTAFLLRWTLLNRRIQRLNTRANSLFLT